MSNNELIALVISSLSLVIAAVALGWNIYRDIILKPRAKVTFGRYFIADDDKESIPETILLKGVNHGPGKVKMKMVLFKQGNLIQRMFKMGQNGFVKITEPPTEYSDMLPKELDVGDEISIVFPKDVAFAQEEFSKIGFLDNYGRSHWARSKDIREFRNKVK